MKSTFLSKGRQLTNNSLYQGTLDLLIFRAVANQSLHGWGISQWLEQHSKGLISVPQGSLYPALHRLERQGLLKSKWGQTSEGRKAKFYRLSEKGKKSLVESQTRWEGYAAAVSRIIRAGS